MKCICNCTSFKMTSKSVTEYHDAEIEFNANVNNGQHSNRQFKYSGSYYLLDLTLTCTNCKVEYKVIEDGCTHPVRTPFESQDELDKFIETISDEVR